MKIASSYVRPYEVIMKRIRIKEDECVPDSAGYKHLKTDNYIRRGKLMKTEMRNCRKKSALIELRTLW